MAIAAPVVGAAPIGASPPALHSGAPSGGASGGAGSPPRCGAPPPVGALRGFCSSGAFCLLVADALQAEKGRALCGDASSAVPLDRARFLQQGDRLVIAAARRLCCHQADSPVFPCAVRLFQPFRAENCTPGPLKTAYSAAFCARHLCRPQQAHPRAHTRARARGTQKGRASRPA